MDNAIVKNSFAPLPAQYSVELKQLVTDMLEKNPSRRPDITSILERPFLQHRIKKFLSPEAFQQEFSAQPILHGQELLQRGQQQRAAAAAARPKPVARSLIPAVRKSVPPMKDMNVFVPPRQVLHHARDVPQRRAARPKKERRPLHMPNTRRCAKKVSAYGAHEAMEERVVPARKIHVVQKNHARQMEIKSPVTRQKKIITTCFQGGAPENTKVRALEKRANPRAAKNAAVLNRFREQVVSFIQSKKKLNAFHLVERAASRSA